MMYNSTAKIFIVMESMLGSLNQKMFSFVNPFMSSIQASASVVCYLGEACAMLCVIS